MNVWTITLAVMLLLVTTLNPLGDAIRDKGNKELQKNIEGIRDLAWLAVIFSVPRLHDLTIFICFSLSYVFLRVAIHNLIYNAVMGYHWLYTGSTSVSDRLESKVSDKGIVVFSRITALVFSVVLFYIGIINY